VKASVEQTAETAVEPAASAVATGRPAAALVLSPPRGRGADPLRQAAALRLQRTHGNAAVSGWLARKPLPADSVIHGLGSAAIVGDDVEGTLYDAPDDSRPSIGTLAKDQSVTLIGTAGDFYIVEVDGKRAYVKQTGIATAIDTPGDEVKADWDKKLRAMSERLDKSGHTGGAALSGGGANVRIFFDYIGQSTKNAAAADKMKVKSTRHMGGYVENGKRSIDWCTQSTSTAVMDALAESKTGVTFDKLQAMLPKAKGNITAPAAYTAPLMPGDMVMYLFAGCQFGGHAVTVIDDLGDSFTHVSGNSTNAGVMIGEEKRLTKEPAGFDLAKATPGPVYDENKKIDKAATQAAHDAASAYLRKFDGAFGDSALIYSIVRYGTLLNGLTAPKPKA
jgi:hypothetical protein